MEGHFVEVGYLLYLLCEKFEFTFNIKNLSTAIKLTITESVFFWPGTLHVLKPKLAHLYCLEKPNWLSE